MLEILHLHCTCFNSIGPTDHSYRENLERKFFFSFDFEDDFERKVTLCLFEVF